MVRTRAAPVKNAQAHTCDTGTRDTAGIQVTTSAILSAHRFLSKYTFLNFKVQRKILILLKSSLVSSSNAVLHKDYDQRDATNLRLPLYSISWVCKRGHQKIQSLFLHAISENQVKVQHFGLQNEHFHHTPLSNNGWESSATLSVSGLAPKS